MLKMRQSSLDYSLLILRVVIGVIFLVHGFVKLFGGISNISQYFGSLSIPLPSVAATVVAILEFFGGIMLIAGIFTRYVSVLFILEMLIALFLVHIKQGFIITPEKVGVEFVLTLIAVLAALILSGGGSMSIDRMFLTKNKFEFGNK